ncbi:uncharacterized protein Dvar_73340 [Desulfosarcina variabilis str. Montpellier]
MNKITSYLVEGSIDGIDFSKTIRWPMASSTTSIWSFYNLKIKGLIMDERIFKIGIYFLILSVMAAFQAAAGDGQ